MLFENNTLRMFNQFCEQPTKQWHLRALARNTQLSTTATKNALAALLAQGLIQENNSTLYKTYQARWGNEQYHFFKKINNRLQLQASGLIERLEQLTPDCIILFGSYDKGEDSETSDIDLYLQSSEEPVNLTRFEKQLKRKIQLTITETPTQLPEELANNIDNGTIISGFKRWQRLKPHQTKNEHETSTN